MRLRRTARSRAAFASAALTAVMALSAWVSGQGTPGTPRLTDAIRSGDVARAAEMLKQGAKADAADADGMTALHWAVHIDDVGLAKTLLAAGAKVNAASRYGVTPLALAGVNGSTPMTELLLNAGADPNAASGEGETVLMAAARTGRPEVLKRLLARGADPNAAERSLGETALMWAAAHDHGEAVHALVQGGANPNARTTRIELPKAKVDFSFAVATALPRGGFTALMLAARQGKIEGVTALADAGADMNLTDPEGATAIVIAVINGHFETAARLAEKGADPNIGDASGMAALYAAVDMAHPPSLTNRPPTRPSGSMSAAELVESLLKRGADPNQALKGPILMKQHTNGDASLGAGTTPLMRAVKAFDVEIMKSLIDHGADVLRKPSNGQPVITQILAGRGARVLTPDAPIFLMVQSALDHGLDPNAPINGSPLLHQSLDRGVDFVRMLVDRGAKLDVKDATGRTPLDIATGIAPSAPAAPAVGGGGGRGGAPGRGGPAGGGGRGGVPARGGAGPGGRGAPAAGGAAPIGTPDATTVAFLKSHAEGVRGR